MKTLLKSVIIATALLFMLIADVPILFESLVPDADAIYGVRRRTRRRTAVVVGTAATATTAATYQQQTAAAQQQAAAAQQEAAVAKQEAEAAKQEAEAAKKQAAPAAQPPPATGKPLPLGTVVSALPAGCTPTPVGGVQYYYCGGNFFRAVFQGNTLAYVTAKP